MKLLKEDENVEKRKRRKRRRSYHLFQSHIHLQGKKDKPRHEYTEKAQSKGEKGNYIT